MRYQNSKQRSWWESDVLAYPRDLIVIGSGITGLSAAVFFKRMYPNKSVLVLDRGFWPSGATGRNAGFACFGSAGELVDDLKSEPEEAVKRRLEFRFKGLELLKNELGANHLDYRMCGGYELFDESETEHYRRSLDYLPLFNDWVRDITGEKDSYEMRKYNGFNTVFNRLEGCLHSGKLLNRLREKAVDAGAEICWNTPVVRLTGNGVVLDDGLELQAHNVLTAVNGFTGQLLPDTGIKPARGYVFVTKPLKNLQWKGTCHYNRGYVYFRDVGDRLLLGGARDIDKKKETNFSLDINPVIKDWLMDFATHKLGIESGWEIEQEWCGTMGFGSSKTPVCKKAGDGVWVAAGLGGMGVALGMELGRKAAEMIAD